MIELCNDMDHVRKFMLLPEVYRYCAEFGVNKDKIEFSDGPRQAWLTYNEYGLIDMRIETGSMCSFHPYILRSNKSEYGAMILEFFAWFAEFMPVEAVKLNATIATIFKGAIAAAEKAGMKMEGVDRLSYRAESGVYDRLLFGITREEM